MRIPKINMTDRDRTYGALYCKNSDFRWMTQRDEERQLIGEGLFSHLQYTRGDTIAVFKGQVMSVADYDAQCNANPHMAGYGVALNNGMRMQCYHVRFNGTCKASVANCAKECVNISTGRNAINNCRLVVNNDKCCEISV